MYRFDAVIEAEDRILDRIESVAYILDPTYPDAVRTIGDRETHFKLKELAWDGSTLAADVRIRGQETPIRLSRYITLDDAGPRI